MSWTSVSIVGHDLERAYGGSVDVAQRVDVLRTHARANVSRLAAFVRVDPTKVNVINNGVDLAWLDLTTMSGIWYSTASARSSPPSRS